MKICLITFFFSFSLYSGYDFDFGGGGFWWKQKENKTSVKRENNAGIMDLVNGFQLSVERTRDGHGFALWLVGKKMLTKLSANQLLHWTGHSRFPALFFLTAPVKLLHCSWLLWLFSFFFVRHQIEICHSTARLIDTGFCSSVVYGEVVSIHFFPHIIWLQKKRHSESDVRTTFTITMYTDPFTS